MSEAENNYAVLNSKLDQVLERLDDLRESQDMHRSQLQAFEVWKATIEGRLAQGTERMNAQQMEIDQRVKKETILAWVLGSAGGAAGLMKLLGG